MFSLAQRARPKSPTAQFYCSNFRYNGHQSALFNTEAELSQIIIHFLLLFSLLLSSWVWLVLHFFCSLFLANPSFFLRTIFQFLCYKCCVSLLISAIILISSYLCCWLFSSKILPRLFHWAPSKVLTAQFSINRMYIGNNAVSIFEIACHRRFTPKSDSVERYFHKNKECQRMKSDNPIPV